MSEENFPSGPWIGFYSYAPQDRHRMDLNLAFAEGRLSGDGSDDVGIFTLRGRYDPASLECYWIKSYPGSHDVFYSGYREGRGIWGRWDIGMLGHGGFHIWPKAASEGGTETEAAAAMVSVEAVARPMIGRAARVVRHQYSRMNQAFLAG